MIKFSTSSTFDCFVIKISGSLADLLSQYASLLASQGNLQTALTYLGSSQNEKVAALRDRLVTSLGQKPMNVLELRQQQGTRRGSTRTSFSGYAPPNSFNNPPALQVSLLTINVSFREWNLYLFCSKINRLIRNQRQL